MKFKLLLIIFLILSKTFSVVCMKQEGPEVSQSTRKIPILTTKAARQIAERILNIWQESSHDFEVARERIDQEVFPFKCPKDVYSAIAQQLSYLTSNRLISVTTCMPLQILRDHTGRIESVAWDPTGRYLASGSSDGTVRVWDKNNNLTQELKGNTNTFWSVAWDPTGRYLASGSSDGTVRIWDKDNNFASQILGGYTSYVMLVAWDPTGRYLASGSGDGTVYVWALPTDKLSIEQILLILGIHKAMHPNDQDLQRMSMNMNIFVDYYTYQLWYSPIWDTFAETKNIYLVDHLRRIINAEREHHLLTVLQ